MIIGLMGFAGSGKGTVADILVREHGYTQFAFADALKDAVSTIFLWPRGLLEGDSEASRKFRETPDEWWSKKLGYEVTPRLILQRMGTEACRNNIADNIWIAALEKRIQGYHNVVISDVRFPNEANFIRSAGGKLMWVKRGPMPTEKQMENLHASEKAWLNEPFDKVIHNDGTLEELRGKVNDYLSYTKEYYNIMHHSV